MKFLFVWLSKSWLGVQMTQSTYGFAITEMFHLIALALLGGAILAVDLRLLGVAFRRQEPAVLATEVSPIVWGSLIVLILSGLLMVASEALKCYYSPAFRLKMLLLAIAVAFYLIVQKTIVRRSPVDRVSSGAKLAAVVSMTLWLSVGVAGRAIGFL